MFSACQRKYLVHYGEVDSPQLLQIIPIYQNVVGNCQGRRDPRLGFAKTPDPAHRADSDRDYLAEASLTGT